MATTIHIEDNITVGALAEALRLPVTRLIGELMKNGIMTTINERLDFDTAQIIVGELGLDVELERKVAAGPETAAARREKHPASANATPRPPVVAVMGHVDHGKTSLLDAIRGAQVAKGEAGGITQHISAYQVEHKAPGGGASRMITFLDTPGHEAFAAIREHGAHLTDIVILVVAADDGVKPQTIEAIRYARNAGAKMVVAINKIDKEGANSGLVMGQLAEQGVVPDLKGWNGDVPMVEVSAKTGQNIDTLLDTVLLVADVEELSADATTPARGLIIEAHVENGRGPIAHALIEEGTLKPGQFIVSGATYAKIRNLDDTNGKAVKTAGPSTPVVISGFKTLPEFGDPFTVVKDEKVARAQAQTAAAGRSTAGSRTDMSSSELLRIISRSNQLQELPIIIKTDVQGSLTSVADSLKSVETDEVAVRIVGSGAGVVSENDIHLARSAGAIIYGFNISAAPNIRRLAGRDQVPIRLYNVIYELIDDVKNELSKLLPDEIIEKGMGELEIKGVFKTTRTDVIAGGEVLSGTLKVPAFARITRGKEQIGEAELTGLKRGPNEARDLATGELGGISLRTSGRLELQLGDKITFFTRETVERTL